jgi:uncharacterized protein YjiS (DUF1127 family)
MLKNLFATVQKQIADYRRYRRAIAEIESLSQRDLADMRGDQTEMCRQAWYEVYGAGKA